MHALLLPVAAALAAGGDPKLEAPTEPLAVGQAVALRVKAPAGGKLWIDGCEPIELEKHEGDAWAPVSGVSCPRPVVATLVDKELTLTVPAPLPGEYRAVLSWGANCATGEPFAMAGCRKIGATRSNPFTVASAGTTPPAQ